MRRILLTTATLGALAFGAAGAMAQTAAPVPNASGSQTTSPNSYGATVPQNQGQMGATGTTGAGTTGNCAPVPNASGSQTTSPCITGSTVPQNQGQTGATGSAAGSGATAPPVPNASGSQTTNPNTIGNTKKP